MGDWDDIRGGSDEPAGMYRFKCDACEETYDGDYTENITHGSKDYCGDCFMLERDNLRAEYEDLPVLCEGLGVAIESLKTARIHIQTRRAEAVADIVKKGVPYDALADDGRLDGLLMTVVYYLKAVREEVERAGYEVTP